MLANDQRLTNSRGIKIVSSSDMPPEKKGSDLNQPLSQRDSLVAEINELHHELRRVRDGLVRAGGSSHELERSERQLSKNIRLCREELAENSMQRDSSQLSSEGND